MDPITHFDADDSEARLIALEGLEIALYSRKGPGKEVNEDAAAILPCEQGCVFVVADGMGGHNSGERASRLAVEAIAQHINDLKPGENVRHALLDGIEEANRAVLALGIGAGTTLVVVHIREGRARSFHVGDAAALHVGQRGKIKRRTLDHSPTAYAVEAGLLEESEAIHHQQRHVVTNFVGTPEMRVEVGAQVDVDRRDTLLLASDGVLDNLHLDEAIELIRSGQLGDVAEELARKVGGRMLDPEEGAPCKPDDVTWIVMRRTS